MLHLLLLFDLLFKDRSALIETQRTVLAALGEEAHFSCRLLQHKDVVQVTWQKSFPEGDKNLVSYHKVFGSSVNPDFIDKVELKSAGLQNSSIIIMNVTEQEEGCYYCLFKTFPEGAFIGTTCLQLYELQEPVLHVRESNSEEAVVSCSATGRPAPTVTLSVLRRSVHFSNYSSVSVSNTNGTVTVTTTAVLSRFNDSSTQVGCAARVLSGPQVEVFLMIPELQPPADGLEEESGSNDRHHTVIIVVASIMIVVGCAAVVLIVHRRRQNNQNREAEMNERPEIRETYKTEELLITQGDDQIRQETPPGKGQTSDKRQATSITFNIKETGVLTGSMQFDVKLRTNVKL